MRFILFFHVFLFCTSIEAQNNRPQTPKEPFPYRTEKVTIFNSKDSVYLSGTLSLPEDGENFTCAILVSGGGPSDRDEEYYGHKPFLVLSDYLTRKGFAVFRYDDRGVGKSTGSRDTTTTIDYANDAKFILQFLKLRPELDTTKIGMIGHSEGAMIAPIVASDQTNGVGFVIMMAGPGVNCGKTFVKQQELLYSSLGRSKKEVKWTVNMFKKGIKIIGKEGTVSEIKPDLIEFLEKKYDSGKDPDFEQYASKKEFVDSWLEFFASEWTFNFMRTNPSDYLTKVTCPTLVLNGEKDIQVYYEQNLPSIEKLLKKAGNSNYRIKSFPNVNHMFQPCETGFIDEYESTEITIAPEVLEEIGSWLSSGVSKESE